MLTFDSNAAFNALVSCLVEAAENAMKAFKMEADSGLSSKGRAAVDLKAAELIGGLMIQQDCLFYADAIAESYGIGSGADTGPDSYWNEYTRNMYFNPARKSTTIVGRPAGSYFDIWGRSHRSAGLFEGVVLEGITYFDKDRGVEVTILPVQANYAIQNAERRFKQGGRIKREIDLAIDKWISMADIFFIEV